MLLILMNVLIIVVVGALIFYLIDRFVRDFERRGPVALANVSAVRARV